MRALYALACLLLSAPLSAANAQSLRLGAGGQLGLGSYHYGEAVNSSTQASGSSLNGSGGGPLAFSLQWLRTLDERWKWEAGASLGWRNWAQSDLSSKTEATTRSDSVEINAGYWTLSADAYRRWPLGKGWLASAGLGLGAGLATFGYDEILSQTTGVSIETKRHTLKATGFGPALKAGGAVEYALAKRAMLGLALEFQGLWAGLSGDSSISYTDQNGAATQPTQSGQGILEIDKSLSAMALTLSATLRFRL